MTIREFGARAISELLIRLRQGKDQTRQSALILLDDLRDPAALPGLRDLARSGLARTTTPGNDVPDAKTVAIVLGILTRMKDWEGLPLFKAAFRDADSRIHTAGIVGLRELEAVEFLPELAARLGQEQDLINRELDKKHHRFLLSESG